MKALATVLMGALVSAGAASAAEPYPLRPIRMIVAFSLAPSGGSSSDSVHDAVAVVQVLRPDLLRTQPCTIGVQCSDGPDRGDTGIELGTGPSWLSVTTEVEAASVADLVVTRVADYFR